MTRLGGVTLIVLLVVLLFSEFLFNPFDLFETKLSDKWAKLQTQLSNGQDAMTLVCFISMCHSIGFYNIYVSMAQK